MPSPLYKKSSKTYFFFVIFGFVALCLFLLSYTYKKTNEQYNIIIISVDTLRPDHLGIYGYDKNTTPQIDAWAKNATVFTQARTVVPFTYPSFAALMTGQHPYRTNIIMNAVSPPISNETPTLSTILKENNYSTAAFVTNRFIGKKYSGLNKGFNEFKEYDAFGTWKEDRNNYLNHINSALLWLNRHKDEKLFLWVHLMDPHYVYYPPKEYRHCDKNNTSCIDIKNSTLSTIQNRGKTIFGYTKDKPDNESIQFFTSLYDGEIRFTDQLVGKILRQIQSLNLENNTVVIFLSDHGEGFEHNYNLTHGEELYESSIRIPLIIKLPGQSNIITNSQVITNVDILPTILDILKISYPKDSFDGLSFKHNLNTKSTKERESYFININASQFAVVSYPYKYLYYRPNAGGNRNTDEELYNIQKDPNESQNIIDSNASISKHLKQKLLNEIESYNFQIPISDIPYPNNDVIDALKALQY